MSLFELQKSCVHVVHNYVSTEREGGGGGDGMSSSIATTRDMG